MAISGNYNPQRYAADGATKVFGIAFAFAALADIVVALFDATGNPVAPAPVQGGAGTYDFTATGNLDTQSAQGFYASGSITFNNAPPAGYTVFPYRDTAETQGSSFTSSGPFPAKAVEGGLDRDALVRQELSLQLARVLQQPTADASAISALPNEGARANGGLGSVLGFDANGNPVALPPPTSLGTLFPGVPAEAYATMADADAAAAGLGTYVDFSRAGNLALTGDLVLTAPWRKFGGNGIITCGAHALTGDFFAPSNVQLFNPADTGALILTNGAELPVAWFGALGSDGVGDYRAAIQRAIACAQASGGGTILVDRKCLIGSVAGLDTFSNGLVIPFNSAVGVDSQTVGRVHLRFVGDGALLAGADNMIVLRLSDSFSNLYNPVIDANGHAGVIGRAFIPENIAQVASNTYQMYNRSYGGQISGCRFMDIYECGPTVAGVSSGCWYNESFGLNGYNNLCGVWMRNSTSGGNGGNNRNRYLGGRVGQGMHVGIWIDDGTGNEFGFHLEGVDQAGAMVEFGANDDGTATGAYIANAASPSGADNNGNMFGAGTWEGVTRPFKNNNPLTLIRDLTFSWSASSWPALPFLCVGNTGGGPQILNGQIWQGNGEIAGYGNGTNFTGALQFLSSWGSPQQPQGVSYTTAPFGFVGSYYSVSGPGGGGVTQNFAEPFSAGAAYLVASSAISNANSAHSCWRLSLFVETASGTFVETNLATVANTITTNTISLTRLGTYEIELATQVSGGVSGETLIMNASILRLL